MLQSTAAASERVFEFLEESEEDITVEHPVSIDGLEGRVDFEHVSFGYNPDKIIIHDFTAHVKPGQKIAIVGPTGAGKTTMIKLLMRFYDVNAGAILVDGHDIRDFNRSELRQMFGMGRMSTAPSGRYGWMRGRRQGSRAPLCPDAVRHNEEASNIPGGRISDMDGWTPPMKRPSWPPQGAAHDSLSRRARLHKS